MLAIIFSSRFKRSYRKRPAWLKEQIRERLRLFANDRSHELLKDHALGGQLEGVRSFSVSGDLRVHYEYVGPDSIYLVDLGTHHELYGN